MAEIYGMPVPDELINMSIEDFVLTVDSLVGPGAAPRFLRDMLIAGVPSLSAMRDQIEPWQRNPTRVRGLRHLGLRPDQNETDTSRYIYAGTEYVPDLADGSGLQLQLHADPRPPALSTPTSFTKWNHKDMMNLLIASVPNSGTEVGPRRNGQEVSVNMFSTYGKGILCHVNHYGELWLHRPLVVEKMVSGPFNLEQVYQTIKEVFTIDLYLTKDSPYLINLLDTPARVDRFKPKHALSNGYYIDNAGFFRPPTIEVRMEVAADYIIATGMEDLYSIISKKITVAQPERKVDFRVVQGRLGRI